PFGMAAHTLQAGTGCMTLRGILRGLLPEGGKDNKLASILKLRANALELVPESFEKSADVTENNPLLAFFDARMTGRGIWKWRHYFEPYVRHLQKFKGKDAVLLEIGIYSGGSLEMWRDFFGEKLELYGVDIEP